MIVLLNNPLTVVLCGFLLTAPFILLEWMNTPGFWGTGFPPLFFAMWFCASAFTFLAGSLLKDVKEKRRERVNYTFFTAKIALIALMSWIFVGLVIDQWPCFTGVPNCD